MKWDHEDSYIIGKTVLIGAIYFNKDKKETGSMQWWGTILAFNMSDGLKINLKNEGKLQSFPPFKDAMRPAVPGVYELKATGEIIENPDFIYTIASYE